MKMLQFSKNLKGSRLLYKNLLFILIFSILFQACENKNIQKKIETKAVEVGFITAKKVPFSTIFEATGRVKAQDIAQIRPQISGIVEDIVFKEGSFVKKGDILYKIDDSTYKATLNQAKASLNSAKANLQIVSIKKNRVEELSKFDGISKQELDDIKANYLQAQALVLQKEAELELAKINLERTNIKAPISGYIGISNITKGALVLANQSEALATIINSDFVNIDLNISYLEFINLKNDIDFNQKIEVTIFINNKPFEVKGILESKELNIDESSSTVTLRARVKNINNTLLQGVFVKAVFENPNKVDSFLIPQQAVLRDQRANPVVSIIKDNNRIEKRVIQISRAVNNKWLVRSGINEDDKIIIEGLNKINNQSLISAIDLNNKYKD